MKIKTKITQSEIKFVGNSAAVMAFSGYASKFNGIDAYLDTILPGAFRESLAKNDRPVLMKRNHYDGVIGKWTKIEEDEIGLYVEGELTPGHSKAEDTYALIKHGAISGLSIGYFPIESTERVGDGKMIRELRKIDLYEISIVDSPADIGATISDIKLSESLAGIESCLRSRGFSQGEATAIVAQVKRLSHGDRADKTGRIAKLLQNFTIFE
jgi:HK97 family phage prohead protease